MSVPPWKCTVISCDRPATRTVELTLDVTKRAVAYRRICDSDVCESVARNSSETTVRVRQGTD